MLSKQSFIINALKNYFEALLSEASAQEGDILSLKNSYL